MSDLKKKGGKKTGPKSKAAKVKSAVKKTVKEKEPKASQREGGILVEAAYNVEEGVKVVSEKAAKIAEKGTEVAGDVYDRLLDGLSDVYKFGSKLVDEMSQTAQDYIEKFEYSQEMRKLSEEKNVLLVKFGSMVYMRNKMKNVKKEDILKTDEIKDLIKDIGDKDKEIIKVGKKLEQLEK